MREPGNRQFQIVCPCCGARLLIDRSLGKILSHERPPKPPSKAADLTQAGKLLAEEAARREALFRQSTEDEKRKAELLARKFEEALKKSKGEPLTRPTRDIDLD
jgi:hypothetical protein